MDLLEYQAKALFREMGIPVLPSQRIDNPRELKGLRIPYPVVLKSQVRTGGRGKAGGIRFAENTIDAIAAARTIFTLPILGEYPQVLLAEAKYNADQEFYLAVVLDYALRRPVLLGSAQGGINLEAVMQNMQQVVVDQEFSSFYARHLMVKMGLSSTLIQSVSAIVEKMYQLFIQKDLDIVEINPLGVSPTGEVMALDGKVTVNDATLGRHPDLVTLLAAACQKNYLISAPYYLLPWMEAEGNIAILCNGRGMAIATLDLVYQAQGKPACCMIVNQETSLNATSAMLQKNWQQAVEQITQLKNVKVILVNILGNASLKEQVTAVIANYWQKKTQEITSLSPQNLQMPFSSLSVLKSDINTPDSRSKLDKSVKIDQKRHNNSLHFVLRFGGHPTEELEKEAQTTLPIPTMEINWLDNLDQAIQKAVSLAKSTIKHP